MIPRTDAWKSNDKRRLPHGNEVFGIRSIVVAQKTFRVTVLTSKATVGKLMRVMADEVSFHSEALSSALLVVRPHSLLPVNGYMHDEHVAHESMSANIYFL